MARDSPRGRWRYIAFKAECDAPFARNDFLGALLSAAKGTPMANSFRITVFEEGFGILKVPHTLKNEAIGLLSSVESVKGSRCRVVTLKTSGTILTLKEKYNKQIRGADERSE